MATRDYYTILEIPRDASETDIKKAYRRAALKYHPDRNAGNPQAAKRFREAAAAYEVLSDPEKRKLYDQFGTDFEKKQRAPGYEEPVTPKPHKQPSAIMEELYIDLAWQMLKEYGQRTPGHPGRFVPAETFDGWFQEELQGGIHLPFVYERMRHPVTGAPVVWIKKIKKATRHTTFKQKDSSFYDEALKEVGLSPGDLLSKAGKQVKDTGVSIGVKILKTIMGRK
jgi:curved DNA-binding protein CbpA